MGRLDRSPKANWVEKKGGLPDYIDRIAVHLHEKGMPISQAIAVAINAVKKACATGDLNFPGMQNENAGSRAQACAAVAQWEALKASHVTPNALELSMSCTSCAEGRRAIALAGTFNSALHPHAPAGSSTGGQFAPARNSQAAEAQKDPKAGEAYKKTLGAGDAKAQLAGMSNDDLIALSKAAYSFKSSDPKVVALRIQLANEIAKRGGNVNDYGGLGKPTPGGPKPLKEPADVKPAAPAPAPAAAATKSSTRSEAAKKAAATRRANKAKAAQPTATAHAGGRSTRLAFPATTSGDGPAVVMNGNLKTPGHIKAAVKAHGKVPPALQAGYRKKVIGAAKKMGALRHVPPAWLHGKEA